MGFWGDFGSGGQRGVEIGGQLAADRAKLKLQSKLKIEERRAESDFDDEKTRKKNKALIDSGFYDNTGVERRILSKINAESALQPNELNELALANRETALKNQDADFASLRSFQEANKEANAVGMSLAPSEEATAAGNRQGLRSTAQIQEALSKSIRPNGDELKKIQELRSVTNPAQSKLFERGQTKKEFELKERSLDIQEQEAQTSNILRDLDAKAKGIAIELQEQISSKGRAEAVASLEGQPGVGSGKFEGGLTNVFRGFGRVGKAAFDIQPLSATDKEFVDSVQKAIENNKSIKSLKTKGKKFKDNEINIIAKLYEVDRAEVLSELGITEKQVDKKGEKFGKRFTEGKPFRPRFLGGTF